MRPALWLLLGGLLPASVPAAEAIVVSDAARGSPVVQDLRTQAVGGVRAAAGWPRVMKASELGLAGERLLTVVGICEDRKAAQRVVAALRGKLAARVVTVEGEWTAACPAQDPPPPKSQVEAKPRARVEKDPKDEDARYDYAQYLQMAGRLDEADAQLDALLKLNPDHADGRTLKAVIAVLRGG